MDKETLSKYGWVVIVIIILVILMGIASPFGAYISASVTSTLGSFTNAMTDNAEGVMNFNTNDLFNQHFGSGSGVIKPGAGGSEGSDSSEESGDSVGVQEVITNYSKAEIESNELLYPIGETEEYYVVAEFNSDFSEVTITKNGADSDGVMKSLVAVDENGDLAGFTSPMTEHCDTLETAVIEEGVANVGAGAFVNANLETGEMGVISSVKLPSSVKTIDEFAFAFALIEDVDFPKNIEEIKAQAFYSSALNNVYVESDNIIFNADAFSTTYNLSKVYIEGNVVLVDSPFYDSSIDEFTATNNCVIGTNAFYSARNLKTVNVFETTAPIGFSAFGLCSSLESVIIETGTTSVSQGAFSNCANLEKVKLPDNTTQIGDNSFYGCKKLVDFQIPSSVTQIGFAAFSDCSSLVNIVIPETMDKIENHVFNNCSGLKSVFIPSTVKTIGDRAFWNCTNLQNVEFSEGITEIGSQTFRNCQSLTNVVIPNSVITIGSEAFEDCKGIANLTIGRGVTKIFSYTFDSCSSLKTVTFLSDLTTIEQNAFSACPIETVYGYADSPAEAFANNRGVNFIEL